MTENVNIPVTAIAASEVEEEVSLIKTGTLAPGKQAKALSVTSGSVQRIQFRLGSYVRQGQVLAIIDTRLLQYDLQRSLFNESKLKNDLQTYTELLAGNAATREKVNEIRLNYEDALNQVQQLRKQIADASIKAPVSGTIYTKPIEEGAFIATGGEIASIADLSSLKAAVYLTESEVYQVKPGQQVQLTTEVYADKVFEGKVTFISPQANGAFNYFVEITVANDSSFPLRAGTFVNADFSKKTLQKILLIPREALNESTQDASVYVVEGGKARLRKINTGKGYGNKIQVTGGLQPAELVVTSGQINLKDGASVNVSNSN
ncbi:efflux RND transporter periplasmic adaptor subunit [Chitinophaga niabensis]|uniref:efflux RND transporter periplasmic adaptor subunit n=1 Tax=Chitinophaga niabensis TaxID=536979 RepID=UPI001F178F03|nr:efflux RND transporter periplasmic adaptor subunit [Chitinophaga niabensis]